MLSILILAQSKAIPVVGWWLALLIAMIGVVIAAVAQWILGARTKKAIATRLVLLGGSTVFFYMVLDCGGWIPDWLCQQF